MEQNNKNYLEYLAELYPTIGKASTEIINLQSILTFQKELNILYQIFTESFEAFSHVLRNGSER